MSSLTGRLTLPFFCSDFHTEKMSQEVINCEQAEYHPADIVLMETTKPYEMLMAFANSHTFNPLSINKIE